MNKDKKWLIKEFGKLPYEFQNGHAKFKAVDVLPLLNQLDETKKVVIPRFVAEAFEEAKVDNWFASSLINLMYDSSDEVAYWLEIPSNEKLLLRAWLDGYEIEKEKLYYVVDEKGQMLLFKSQDHGVLRSNGADFEKVLNTHENDPSNMYQLTEKEIRDYDPRFMLFVIEA